GIASYLHSIAEFKRDGAVVSSIVVNCNPFTLGHQYLIEKAASESDILHVFVVWEDKSSFPSSVRYELVKKGTAHLSNVVVHKGKNYVISNATFPSYFLKDYDEIVETHAHLDLNIFGKYIVPALGINRRYVGEEPYCKVTKAYNTIMKNVLPQYGVKVIEIPRLENENGAISASKVREIIKQGRLDDVCALVPKTTYEYLKSPEAENIIANIMQKTSRH
ncbi:MAG: adenylyltransferase/cytidyltransferase family protein, partial [Caulobacteraceae bacterium]